MIAPAGEGGAKSLVQTRDETALALNAHSRQADG